MPTGRGEDAALPMQWDKLGLVWTAPEGSGLSGALQPTPVVLGDRIRVFTGCRDAGGASSVWWVDLDAEDPTRVVGEARTPALVAGPEGTFDAAGVVPCAVAPVGGTLRLYYAGYQPPASPAERFRVFSGVATAPAPDPASFTRLRAEPLLRTSADERLFRVVHSLARLDDGTWRCWYGAGHEFRQGRTKLLPVYDIRQMDSPDGLEFPDAGSVAVPLGTPEEHRVGRPYVVRHDGGWRMFFGAGTEDTTYRLTFADSADGTSWRRHDGLLGLDVGPSGWDAEMVAYPAVVTTGAGTFLLYNGNGYGRDGFGVAVLHRSLTLMP
ncbi:hypothetical protein GCU60_17645 [Blastococcus saxobsidens]|uniref:Glycosyl hydrolase family 32 N-terminal domain-containing protein n=1 Tax=Blastococcus saxobsidens TaxID=138336 RepID=A0A6L9W673_9ACTN|nr:hypothetical protein [Blastococcus saxobsidens]NEK87565.1 hypothetical protein [Blastococcus saxobsidens]